MSVFRVMRAIDRVHPKPKGPLPPPELYDSDNSGPKPERPALVAIGTVIDAVPVTGLVENFSSMPRIAPPPLGSVIEGMAARAADGLGSDADGAIIDPGALDAAGVASMGSRGIVRCSWGPESTTNSPGIGWRLCHTIDLFVHRCSASLECD